MATHYPLISKLISVVFFSLMGGLAFYVAIDRGLLRIVLIVLYASTVISVLATYLLFAWIGYRSLHIYLFQKISSKTKLRMLFESGRPFLLVPVAAFVSCVLLTFFYVGDISIDRVILGVAVVLPIFSLLMGLGVSIWVKLIGK